MKIAYCGSTPNLGNLVGTSNGMDHFGFDSIVIFETTFEGGPLDRSAHFRNQSVWQKCQLPFDKTVVLSAALLNPAYKNNNQTRGGLGRVCATGMYRSIGQTSEIPKFQSGIFVGVVNVCTLFIFGP